MIQISNLQKKFGEKTAVNIDNYLINQGDISKIRIITLS